MFIPMKCLPFVVLGDVIDFVFSEEGRAVYSIE